MEVMKDVSILFYRDKCFFFGCQVSIPLSFKLIGKYHSNRCICFNIIEVGAIVKLLQNIYHNSIFWNITALQIYDMVYN